jgi:hypothetical protein
MEACEVVRLFVNKAIVSAEPKRPGNPGYGHLRAIRILVYARVMKKTVNIVILRTSTLCFL